MGNEPFIGTWRLLRYEYRRPDGALRYPLGEDAVGLLMYDASGFMAGQVMRRDRPLFPSDAIRSASEEQARAALEGYNGYFGTYQVDEEAGIVRHQVIGSWFPNFVGGEQTRHFEFEGEDRLLLRTPPRQTGRERRTGLLIWERVSVGK